MKKKSKQIINHEKRMASRHCMHQNLGEETKAILEVKSSQGRWGKGEFKAWSIIFSLFINLEKEGYFKFSGEIWKICRSLLSRKKRSTVQAKGLRGWRGREQVSATQSLLGYGPSLFNRLGNQGSVHGRRRTDYHC